MEVMRSLAIPLLVIASCHGTGAPSETKPDARLPFPDAATNRPDATSSPDVAAPPIDAGASDGWPIDARSGDAAPIDARIHYDARPVCGNRVVELGEDCDDGNTRDDGNGCDGSCRKNAVCGDGVVQSLYETCDDGNTSDDGNGCDADCHRNSVCGDGVIQSLFETCDDGDAVDTGNGCSSTCRRNDVCGDGATHSGGRLA
jgi:cysteine-rich repeat protein